MDSLDSRLALPSIPSVTHVFAATNAYKMTWLTPRDAVYHYDSERYWFTTGLWSLILIDCLFSQ